jgi:Na+/H+-dicarboxylate symporter
MAQRYIDRLERAKKRLLTPLRTVTLTLKRGYNTNYFASAYTQVMLTIFIAGCYLQILNCLAEATRISLTQSFSGNRSDRVSLDQTP